MGRIPDHLTRLALQVAESRWVTIGAQKDPKRPGQKKGGTPVELDDDGTITKGPAALTGKRPSELSQSHMFSGQDHKSQRKLFAEPGDPVPPPPIEAPKPAPAPEPKPEPAKAAKAPVKAEKPAKQPKPIKAAKEPNMGLLAVVRREGGISSGDYDHADFREFGLLGALKKSGHSLDDMAATLVRQGHITVPPNVASPGDHLLKLLKKKTTSMLADRTSQVEKDYEAYAQAEQEARENGHQERELREIQSGSQEAGRESGTGGILEEIFGWDGSGGEEASHEEPGEPGDSAEPAAGVDTSFDFGPAAAPKVEPKGEPKPAKPRKIKQKKDWEDRQEDKHQKALADIKAADTEKAAVADQARELLGKVKDPGQKAELEKLIARAEGKPEAPVEPPALDKEPAKAGPKIGDKIKTKLGDRNGDDPQFEIELMASDKPGRVAIGQNGVKQQSIPEESLQHFVDDLTGKVSVTPDSGNEVIDAVARSEAKHLGRGDDGAAFQVGDKVAKVSTVTPFIPTNPGHRTSEEGLARLRQQTETHNKLAEILKEKGIGGVEPLEWHEHGGRGFAVSNLLDTKTKLNGKQIDQVRKAVDALHGAGYTVTDDIQVGLDKNGQPVLYDLGKAQKASRDSIQYDGSKFEQFAKKNGHEDALPLRSDLERQLDGIKNSTSKYAEKVRAGLRDKLAKLDALDRGQEVEPEQQADKAAKLWDDLKSAQAARKKADDEGDDDTFFDADTAVQDAEIALKRLGMNLSKPPEEPAPPPSPGADMFGNTQPAKPAPATTPGLFGDAVPLEEPKAKPQQSLADAAEKGLDWLDKPADLKKDGTGEMFGGLFSPGRANAEKPEEPKAPPAVEPATAKQPKVTNDDADKHVASAIQHGDADEYWEENQNDPKLSKAFNHSKQQFLQAVDKAESPDKPAQAEPVKAPATAGPAPAPPVEAPKATPSEPAAAPDKQDLAKPAPAAQPNADKIKSIETEPTTPAAAASIPKEDESPRQTAARVDKAMDADYVFARASEVANFGRDVANSARHKVNAWRGLADAEQNGTAEKLTTRDNLLKVEPHNLAATSTPGTALAHLAAHLAISSMPPKPYSDKDFNDYKKFVDDFNSGNRPIITGHGIFMVGKKDQGPVEPVTAEKLRQNYYKAFQEIKKEAETLAQNSKGDPYQVMNGLGLKIGRILDEMKSGAKNQGEAYISTRSPVYQGLSKLQDSLRGSKGPVGKVREFSNMLGQKYGKDFVRNGLTDQAREVMEKLNGHVLDVMDGSSFNQTFSVEKESGGKRPFSSTEAYVTGPARRTGGRSVQAGTTEVGKKFMMDRLKLSGVQWGNSVTDDERKHHLQKSSEALADLADIIGADDSLMSLGGKLALSIGARGSGNALAHYEPGELVMNLTRKSGVGSLAHEWGHALDHYLGGQKTPSGPGRSKTHFKSNTQFMRLNPDGNDEVAKAVHAVMKSSYSSGFYHRLTKEIAEMQKSGQSVNQDYWQSGHEMFARTFERHIQSKLKEKGQENTYLVALRKEGHPLWPNDQEMEKIGPAFETLFDVLRKRHPRQQSATESKQVRIDHIIRAMFREAA